MIRVTARPTTIIRSLNFGWWLLLECNTIRFNIIRIKMRNVSCIHKLFLKWVFQRHFSLTTNEILETVTCSYWWLRQFYLAKRHSVGESASNMRNSWRLFGIIGIHGAMLFIHWWTTHLWTVTGFGKLWILLTLGSKESSISSSSNIVNTTDGTS